MNTDSFIVFPDNKLLLNNCVGGKVIIKNQFEGYKIVLK